MPNNAWPTNPDASWLETNVRKQIVATDTFASLPTPATEGRMMGDLTNDRYVFDTGAGGTWLPGPNWSSAGRVGFSLTDATNRSIPNGTGTHTALTFGTEVTDSDGFFTAGGTTVTIPTNRGGLYSGMFQCTWASSPGANSSITLLVNGATAWRVPVTAATQLLVCCLPIGTLALAAGDTLQITLSQGSGAAINVNPSQWQMWRSAA